MTNLFKKTLLSIAAGAIMLTSATATAFAANTSTVNITTKPTLVDVTLPTAYTIVFEADGTNTYPNFEIHNNSKIGQIDLKNITAKASGNWKFAPDKTVLNRMPKDTKQIKLKLGDKSKEKALSNTTTSPSAQVTANYAANDFRIAALSTKQLSFVVDRTVFSKSATDQAMGLTLTFDYV